MSEMKPEPRDDAAEPQLPGGVPPAAAAKPTFNLAGLGRRFETTRRQPEQEGVEESRSVGAAIELIPDAPSAAAAEPTSAQRPFAKLRKDGVDRRIHLQLPKKVGFALRVHAIRQDKSVTHVIERAIEEYMTRHGIKP